MKKTFCDRCSNEIKNYKEETFMLKNPNIHEDKDDDEWELCPNCFKDLKLFIHGAGWK